MKNHLTESAFLTADCQEQAAAFTSELPLPVFPVGTKTQHSIKPPECVRRRVQRCGRDEHAAFHFLFSRDHTVFRMMCLAFGSTISPGIMEERLSLCGFIHVMRVFAFLFRYHFYHAWKTSRNKRYHRVSFCSCLSSGLKGSCGVYLSVINP